MTRPLPLPDAPVVLPSVMSADMLWLGDQLSELADAGARAFHVDVMDGHFVPNLTVGPDFTRAVRSVAEPAGVLVDVHLMVSRPAEAIALFAPLADAVSFHLEADPHPHRLLGMVREAGCHAGLAINPGTPVEHLADLAGLVDYVNVLAVNPGFAGQAFIETTPGRVERLRALLPERVRIEVDGGIGRRTLPGVRAAGATMLVSASSVFGADEPVGAFRELQAMAAG
jgi:ribulose-phosphate 3-epimerase